MSQTWPLSQDANKSSGTCGICLATRQLHIKDGTVHRHGPRDDPCPGSNKPPLSQRAVASQSLPVPVQDPLMASGTPTPCTWAPGDFRIIKHIPKSARGACALHLASILRSVVSDAASVSNWQGLFHWAASILQPAKRGGNVTICHQR